MKLISLAVLIFFMGCSSKKTEEHAVNKISGMQMNMPVTNMKNERELPLDSLLQPSNEYVVSSIPVTTLSGGDNSTSLNALGTVNYDNRQIGAISSRIEGRIEKLYVRYKYQFISKGQKVFDIYSPELLTSQQNYIFLLKNDPANTNMIQAAKERLLLEGMSISQLRQVELTSKPILSVSVYSNYSGFVTDASNNVPANSESINMPSALKDAPQNIQNNELQVKEGMYLQKGQSVFSIINSNHVIISLSIFPEQAGKIKKGDLVDIEPETIPGNIVKGEINYIEPIIKSQSNTILARVYFNNSYLKLPVGSPVKATIHINALPGNWLPAFAVYSTGIHNIVFKKVAGGFTAHPIEAGARSNDKIQIISGITIKDSVAINAQQLISSESIIKSK